MPNILRFQLFKCEYFQIFFVLYDSKLNIFLVLDCWLEKSSNVQMSPWPQIMMSWHLTDK